MGIGNYAFRFRWLPTLLLAIALPVFVAFGLWQLDRAEQKRELAELLQTRTALPAYRLEALVTDPEAVRFRKLTARGRFESAGQIFLEGRRHANHAGFHVITPLHIEGGEVRVLVNRGWIPADAAGLPTDAPIPEGLVTVNGETYIPAPPALVLQGGTDAAAAWGERWPYLTTALYAARVDYPVQPVAILEDPADEGGFVRSWPAEPPKEGMHIGYAIQWFAFAVIALILYLRLSLERRAVPKGEAEYPA
jgi:surfeit locus 1 family protein